MEIDHNVGQILDAIDKAGIRNNTIVCFFSDNGPTRYSRQPDQNGDNGIWSGELGSAWEGGLRTVGMIRWPGKIREGWQTTEMIHDVPSWFCYIYSSHYCWFGAGALAVPSSF